MGDLRVIQGGKDESVQQQHFRADHEDLRAAKDLMDNILEIFQIKRSDLIKLRLADHLISDCGFMVQRVELDLDCYMRGPGPAETTLVFDWKGQAL